MVLFKLNYCKTREISRPVATVCSQETPCRLVGLSNNFKRETKKKKRKPGAVTHNLQYTWLN